MQPVEDRDPDVIAGFAKGLAVIEVFDRGRERLTIADVARLTGLERATARRCLMTLLRQGYAEQDGKLFRLSPRILRLGYAYLASTPLPGIVQPFLEALSEATQESCSASILDGAEIVYVARASQRRVMSISLSIGSRLPAWCTSMGRVMLAALPEDERRRRLALQPRRPLTPRTITDEAGLLAAIARAASDDCAYVDQELELGLHSIAVPIRDAHGRVVAAMNIGAQSGRVARTTMLELFLPRMRAAQAELARLLA